MVDIEGRRLRLSNLDKVLYPQSGFTKGQVLDYYIRIAPVLLGHLADRPLTLKRYPHGVEAEHFYQKQCPAHRPDWLSTCVLESDGPKSTEYCMVNDLAGLVWVANLASLEMHTLMARAPDTDRPTMMVLDLDPGTPAGLLQCAAVAMRARDILAGEGLECFAKTSGGKGLHLLVPLNTPADYELSSAFARWLAQTLTSQSPDKVTANMSKAQRPGKVFVDWSQNSRHKTTVCAYSLRARERPTVSTPITWDELEGAIDADDAGGLVFETADVLQRVERLGDLMAPVLTKRQKLSRKS